MNPQRDKTLRHGGMSRRGFLRALGVTAVAVVVPGGLIIPQPNPMFAYITRTDLINPHNWRLQFSDSSVVECIAGRYVYKAAQRESCMFIWKGPR